MPRISTEQLAQMTQREFDRAHEDIGALRQEMRQGFSEITDKLDALNDNLSKTLMVWDRRFTDAQVSVDTKIRAIEKMVASK